MSPFGFAHFSDLNGKHAERVLEVEPAHWKEMKKGDWRKGLVAALIRRHALVDNGWLAERLSMGARNAVSRTIHSAEKRGAAEIGTRGVRRLIARVSKCFD